MAAIGATLMTLADHAKGIDPTGKTAKVVELLSEKNQMLEDMLFKEGNLPTGEVTSIRTGLPTVYWRLLNKGTPTSKSTKAQVTENCGILSARSQIDKNVAELGGDVAGARMSESMSFIEAMSQEMQGTYLYGSAANPEEFVGLSNRYSSLSANNADNILDAGGTGSDNSSIWLVGYGENAVHGIFPKGSKAGLQHEDLGLGDAFDSDNNRFRAYLDDWEWKAGLVVKDWRYAVRICNIDISDLVGLATSQAVTASTSIIKLMSRAIDRIYSPDVKMCFYANRTCLSNLRVAALDKSVSAIAVEQGLNQFGKRIQETRFLGVPVRLVDQLTQAEARVT